MLKGVFKQKSRVGVQLVFRLTTSCLRLYIRSTTYTLEEKIVKSVICNILENSDHRQNKRCCTLNNYLSFQL